MTADKIIRGSHALIEQVLDPELSLYCQDLGVIPGKVLQLLHIAPFGGPMAFKLGETTISLRKDEARFIKVQHLPSSKQ